MNRYIRQFFSLLGIIFNQLIQNIFDRFATRSCNRELPQPDSFTRNKYSFTEIAKRAAEEESEQNEVASTAKSSESNDRHCNKRRKSKRAKWVEEKSQQDSAYAEAKENRDNEGVRDYWKWIKRYGGSTKEYYARAKARRKVAKTIADRTNQMISDEARKTRAEIKADAQCKLPEDIMIEHLEDHRDGIGWSIAALAKKRFYVRRTLKSNDPNGDMFCEVDDNGESLLKAVKQIISKYERSNNNK